MDFPRHGSQLSLAFLLSKSAVHGRCLNLIYNCKITNKVSKSFVQILLERIQGDNYQVKYCYVP